MSTVRGFFAFSLVALATSVAVASCSTASDDGCIPPPGSCDAPAITMNPLDAVQGCLAAPVALTEVCATSVNRCSPSAGLGLACAFAPDGSVFVTVLSDNLVPNAKGWRFALNGADYDECSRAACTKPCPGVEPLHYWPCPDAGGNAPDAGSDATAD